jgi:heme-degrading monooxygenase HmoA
MPHIRTDNQPVTQITVIEPEPGKQAEAVSLMTERARFMARQPGFISISLHRSLDCHPTIWSDRSTPCSI